MFINLKLKNFLTKDIKKMDTYRDSGHEREPTEGGPFLGTRKFSVQGKRFWYTKYKKTPSEHRGRPPRGWI